MARHSLCKQLSAQKLNLDSDVNLDVDLNSGLASFLHYWPSLELSNYGLYVFRSRFALLWASLTRLLFRKHLHDVLTESRWVVSPIDIVCN